jgi:hypothetical protein
MDRDQIRELVLQALEMERGGQQLYEAALVCARSPALRELWERSRRESERHERIAVRLCLALELDPDEESPCRGVARVLVQGLVEAIRRAADTARPEAAQAAAAECVLLAETKEVLHWELIGCCAQHARGEAKRALQAAHAEVDPEERRHLRDVETWARALWLASLGVPTQLPPDL